MLFGEKIPDKNDPHYKERYKREIEAGRKFAKATRIDMAAEMCIRDRMERAEQDMGGLLIDMVGGPDNVAGFFDISNYNLTQWISDDLDKTANTYDTQRWYIACLLYTSLNLPLRKKLLP